MLRHRNAPNGPASVAGAAAAGRCAEMNAGASTTTEATSALAVQRVSFFMSSILSRQRSRQSGITSTNGAPDASELTAGFPGCGTDAPRANKRGERPAC